MPGCRSVLVVVGLMHRVAMLSVSIVDMIEVVDGLMAARGLVHVHVRTVRQVLLARRFIAVGQFIDMV
jgi:hypothetical protein